ncbi:metal-dependent transcriptional regulator [bacterium]|jgi:DtxR family transcriptional regulator, Mn-dependent transcriptional regulator|nr:metal-dependent transcriptional regulator [bacterium]
MEDPKENYLKTIVKLQKGGEHVKPTLIAEALGVTPSAVTDMAKTLQKDGHVDYVPYQGVRLTVKGQMKGLTMIRRHRIWELYLHKVLGYSWDQVHEEAEMLEHASTDTLINKLEEVLQYPLYDPHGDPIPSKTGQLPPQRDFIMLSAVAPGTCVTVLRVNDHDDGFLRYLDEIGVHIQGQIEVKEKRDFDQSLKVSISGKEVTLSHFAAQNIFVTKEES